jgi:DNA-binding NarL/FixJ family response regulator
MMTNEHVIQVLVADDHRLMREGIAALLSDLKDIEIVDAASSGEEAINKVRNIEPDVVLMDIVMGEMNGIEATRWIKEQTPKVKVIIVSSEVKKELLAAGIKSGIDGYLLKDIDAETLANAIRAVYAGERYFTEAITKLIFEDFYFHESLKKPNATKLPLNLTKREYEVLGHVAAGKTNNEVADTLFISAKTVETHKTNILQKLGLRNTAELVKYAIKNNIIPL